MIIAALWGFAEATLFFLVPDIWLSVLAVRHGWKRGLAASMVALAGALVGGLAMYGWGASDAATAREVLIRVPAIDPAMIMEVRNTLATDGIVAIFLGPLYGIPYKIYAVEAAAAGFGPALFLAISIPARLFRFLVVTFVCGAASMTISRWLDLRWRTGLLGVIWIAFYFFYFSVNGI